MNRSELIDKIATDTGLTKVSLGQVLDSMINTVQVALKKGDTVALLGFGTFKTAKRAARVGKNPSTGAALKIPASIVPKFTPGAKLKAAVDPKNAARKAKAAAAK